MAFDAFISYSSDDKAAADATCAVLEGAGIRCWIAPRDIRTGAEYGGAIIDAIDDCRVMILVFSSSANASRQIRREIERAVSKGVPILPVRIEEVKPTKSLEYFLGAIHWLDALSPPLEQHLHKLADTVKAMLKVDAADSGTASDRAGSVSISDEVVTRRAEHGTPPAPAAYMSPRKPGRPEWLLPGIVTGVLVALIAAGGVGLYRLGLLAPAGAPVAPQPGPAAPATLRASAAARNFLIGAAIAAPQLREDAIYSQKVSQEFNIVVPENAMKFGPLRPSRAEFKFDDADSIVEFAFNNGMKVRGQPLIWDGQLARWLMDGKFSAVEVSAILKDHIQTLVARYRGRVYSWDVTNDALDGLGRVRDTIWSKALGEDYLQQVFLWAREADPAVKLFLNNNDNFLLLETADAFYNAVKNLKARGIPIDGIGLHSHWEVDKAPKMSAVAANMKQFAALGLEIHVTELDLRMSLPPTEQNLQRQAAVYREYLTACLSIPNCKAFLTWGFTDKYSWIPRFFPGFGSALPFDTDYKPKPAYAAMLDALNAR